MKQFFSNHWYMLKLIYQNDKKQFILMWINMIINIALTFLSIIITSNIVQMISQRLPFEEYSFNVTLTMALLLVLLVVNQFLNIEMMGYRQETRMNELGRMGLLFASFDYQLLEHEEFRELGHKVADTVSSDYSLFGKYSLILSELIMNLIQIIIFSQFLFQLEPLFILLIILLILITSIYRYFQTQYFEKTREKRGQIVRKFEVVEKTIGNFQISKDMRLYQVSNWFVDLFKNVSTQFTKLNITRGLVSMGGTLIGGLILLFITGMGYFRMVDLYLNDQMTLAQLTLMIGMLTAVSRSSNEFVNKLYDMIDYDKEISSVREFYNYPSIFNYEEKQSLPKEIESIEFIDVSYSYPKSDTPLFKNFDLRIDKNEKIAVVGLNGAGKTTLVKLLTNLYKPDSGQILINGIDNQEFDVREYYKLFSVVFQDVITFPITIKESILQYKELDENHYQEVIRMSGMDTVLKEYKLGDKTPLIKALNEDGVDLSGGQNQKLKLAQALYKDGPILILDEPTAALDPLAENEIYQKYFELSKDKISLFISHRLSSTQFCDRILYLEHGEIVESGTHQQLINKKGKYAELFETQAYYYKLEADNE